MHAAIAAPRDRTHPSGTPLTPYQRWLFFFLGVATFFEGYDLLALAMILALLPETVGRELEETSAL